MKADLDALLSETARRAPRQSFPMPPATVTANFDQGLAAEETFPLDDLKRFAVESLAKEGGRALEYQSFGYDEETGNIIYDFSTYPELLYGYLPLREQIAFWVSRTQARREVSANHIIVTSGSSQGVGLGLQAFVNPGDGVLVESASVPFALRFIKMMGADLRTVPMDRDGMDIDALEERLREYRRDGVTPKLLYTIATFNLPTGYSLSEERRRRLIDVAQRSNLIVLEDAIYSDFRFDGPELPSLLSLDDSGLVIQSHAFSKLIAPAMRLGWVTGSRPMIEAMGACRQDLGVSQWLCRIMAGYMAEGLLKPHVKRATEVYRRRRDLAVALVDEYCGDLVEFDIPKGGFYLWLKVRPGVNWEKARQTAALGGVYCRPGDMFMDDPSGTQYMRLAFSFAPEQELEKGIEVLGKALYGAARTPR